VVVSIRPPIFRSAWAAALVGALSAAAEAFIGAVTVLSGFNFGWFDLLGAVLAIMAVALVGRKPRLAAFVWLLTLPLLYSGRLLISPVCLPVLLLPVVAASLAFWSYRQPRPT